MKKGNKSCLVIVNNIVKQMNKGLEGDKESMPEVLAHKRRVYLYTCVNFRSVFPLFSVFKWTGFTTRGATAKKKPFRQININCEP